MKRLYLVRHGRAEAGFGEQLDPGLDATGFRQAQAVGEQLGKLKHMPILSSPLRRARETASPLALRWSRKPIMEEAVAEIPTPGRVRLKDRPNWLRGVMAGKWSEQTRELIAWRKDLIAALHAQKEDTVIFSHFIAINVAAGDALREDRVHVFSPDNASVTILESDGSKLHVVELGREADTRVL
jgi:broad specificity phosphatase PhoE